jgi:NAD(P)-dependent dehydrogenase (short-subunit alcohol dehydrogenase family)
MLLAGKSAVVTGSTSGIGLGIARAQYGEGGIVVGKATVPRIRYARTDRSGSGLPLFGSGCSDSRGGAAR